MKNLYITFMFIKSNKIGRKETMNAYIKKIITSLVFILIIGMNFISATSKIVQEEEEQSNASIIDEDVDWWPMFHHDLNHSGYSTSTGPETNNILWAYKTEDSIWMPSPAIVDNRVYFGGSSKNFYCIDSDTGEDIWKTPIPNGVGSSPAVENGKVYFGGGLENAGIYCLNITTGEIVWRYQTPGYNGVCGSPAFYKGKVIITARNPEPGCIYCLDADTGGEIWILQNITSPQSVAIYNDRVYFGSDDFNVYCLDMDNGNVIWDYTTEGEYWPSLHVTIYDDKLYAGGDDGLYCLDLEDGGLIWKYPTDEDIPTAPCTADGNVFFAADGGYVYCLNASSGEKIWDFEAGYIFTTSSPAVADGKIYIGSSWPDKKIYCLNATSGEKIWEYITTSYMYSSPAIADGKLYFGYGADQLLLCFGGTSDNKPPHTPKEILGPKTVKVGDECIYKTSTFDPDEDPLYYKWNAKPDWIGPYSSNETVEINITFLYEGYYTLRVIVEDSYHARSDWAELEVRVSRDRTIISSFLLKFLERYPLFLHLIHYLISN